MKQTETNIILLHFSHLKEYTNGFTQRSKAGLTRCCMLFNHTYRQSIRCTMNTAIGHSSRRSISQSVKHSVNRSSIDRSINQSLNQSLRIHSLSHSVCQPVQSGSILPGSLHPPHRESITESFLVTMVTAAAGSVTAAVVVG